ncbi:MAG TPA: shikimate kinase [Candidatus Marinimicrobia bacterium]|jgi:shikimate kinase|nr:shikimate kinase [Candidatus Neomarinimicrobiota bacterium]HBR86500.1 shikimate kinase [Candidatus Neomarinimicrobiota bacterium]|tara:strand:+ start:12876 stop:13367 length:492 start_codon:yes stop_codon:yes gene_type:complete
MNIYLIGMMGSGKTTVGIKLSEKLKKTFIDLDIEIEKSVGKTISELFDENGEDHFRLIESEKLKTFSESVIACGGGVVLMEKNRQFIKENGTVFLLMATMEELAYRLKNSDNRPLLVHEKSENGLKNIWLERQMDYLNTADFSIETEGKHPVEIAEEIILQLN